MKTVRLAFIFLFLAAGTACADPGFEDFDLRAREGQRLNVVFFGASLTWGANATDQSLTSYRAVMANYLEAEYPKAHFKFYDAAIGGTGSQLGVFRLDRDVLSRKPDLVFLDFSANDGLHSDNPEQMASYESLVRRIIRDGHALIVQMIFPFGGNVAQGNTDGMKRRDAHLKISQAYNTVVGDAITFCIDQVKQGKATVAQMWPTDMGHPGDFGYALFAEAGWIVFQKGVKEKIVCRVPDRMLYDDTYMHWARVRISTLYPKDDLPQGWQAGAPNLTAAWHDGLMSRWLDDEVIAMSRKQTRTTDAKSEAVQMNPERVKARFFGSMVMLFGERTTRSGQFRVYIDGSKVMRPWGPKETADLFNAWSQYGGNLQFAEIIRTGLDPAVEHTIEIEPVFTDDSKQELRLESICVAGGQAKVLPIK